MFWQGAGGKKIFNTTAAKQITQNPEGEVKSIYLNGEKELARINNCSEEQVSNHWDHGDRWRYDTGIDIDYRN